MWKGDEFFSFVPSARGLGGGDLRLKSQALEPFSLQEMVNGGGKRVSLFF